MTSPSVWVGLETEAPAWTGTGTGDAAGCCGGGKCS